MSTPFELVTNIIDTVANPRTETELIFADNILLLLFLNEIERLTNFLLLQLEFLKEFDEPTDRDFEENEIQAALNSIGFALFYSPYSLKPAALNVVQILEELNHQLSSSELALFENAYYLLDTG